MPFNNVQERGRPLVIKDEGLTVSGSTASLDFIGAGVTSSSIGDDVSANIPGGGGGTWGSITGTLSSQTDLQTALDAKWGLTGNAGTTAGTNFIGTTDNVDFVTKTNGIERIRTTSEGITGFGTASPAATGDFINASVSIVSPSSLTSAIVWGGAGYAFTSGNKNYDVVYYKTINSVQVFSPTPAQTTFTEPAYTDADPLNQIAAVDYVVTGAYTETGITSDYSIRAVYAGDTQAGNVALCSVTDNNSSNQYDINVSWGAPTNGATRFYVAKTSTSEYRYVDSLSFVDNNTGWTAGSVSFSAITYSVHLVTNVAPSGIAGYRFVNQTSILFQDTGSETTDDNGSWSSGSTTTPTTGTYPSFRSQSSYLGTNGASSILSFFGATGSTQLSGDVATALETYGQITSGTYDLARSTGFIPLTSTTGTLAVNRGGTGQTTYTNGQLLIGNTTGNTLTKATLTGTTDQVVVTNSTGSITLSLPQSINTTSSPTFTRLFTGLGTAALPANSFTGDTNTGMYSAGADTLNFATGGTDRFNISSTGKIGIGMTAVSTNQLALTVGTASHIGLMIQGAASQTGDLLQFKNSAGTVKSAFNKDGYLSVGEQVLNTTSPATYAQSIYYSTNSISDNSATFKTRTDITNTSAMDTYSWTGIWSQIVKTAAATATNEAIYAIGGQIELQSGAGTVSNVKAFYLPMQYSANVTTSRGVEIYSEINAGKTVNTHTSFYVRNMLGAGTLTTQYGIYIEDMTKGGTNFAIRSLGGEVAFMGQTNVGLTGGAGKLSVLSTGEQLRLYYDTSNYLATTVGSTGGVTFDAVGSGAAFTFNDRVGVVTGTTSKVARVGGKIKDFTTSVGNIGTGEDDLYTYTTEAGILAQDGGELTGSIGIKIATSAGTATRQIKLWFGGTAIFDTGAQLYSGASKAVVTYSIIRISSTVVRYRVTLTTTGASLAAYTSVDELTGLTLSNTNVFKITGEAAGVGAATDDIIAHNGDMFWYPPAI